MEAETHDGALLQDLALIYIALAHSTDEELDQTEVDTIADRLRGWQQDVTSETVLSAIKKALDEYVQEDAHAKVEAALRRVAASQDRRQRQHVVDDLVDIAMADGRMIHEESSFIGEVAQAWDVHFAPQDAVRRRTWSILFQDDEHEGWTPLHDLTLLYLTVAHRTDNDLSLAEVEAITSKLSEWLPDADESEVLLVVQEAANVYAQNDQRAFEEAVEAVRTKVPAHQRTALLADLRYVAQADGVLLDAEQQLIDRLGTAWEVRVEA